jgi:hypothetical protein
MINPTTADDYISGLAYGIQQRKQGYSAVVWVAWSTRLAIASDLGTDDPFARGVIEGMGRPLDVQ